MNTINLYIKEAQHVWNNKFRSVVENESEEYTHQNNIKPILNRSIIIFKLPSSHIRSARRKKYQGKFIISYSILKTGIFQFKLFTRKVVEWILKNPALGFVDFLADTYSYLNQSEYKYVYKTKVGKYCFLFKYCCLSFISFYF
jgi:hypothetical protein